MHPRQRDRRSRGRTPPRDVVAAGHRPLARAGPQSGRCRRGHARQRALRRPQPQLPVPLATPRRRVRLRAATVVGAGGAHRVSPDPPDSSARLDLVPPASRPGLGVGRQPGRRTTVRRGLAARVSPVAGARRQRDRLAEPRAARDHGVRRGAAGRSGVARSRRPVHARCARCRADGAGLAVVGCFPGRAFLGVGSGEAMNEVPAGMSWPSTEEQLARTEEALTIITRLLNGERVDFDGRFFKTNGAMLYSRPPRRPPVYMSSFYEGAAEVAGRLADGVWTLGDPMKAPKVLAAYRKSCEEAGREPGEIILQMVFSVAGDDDTALEQAREWKGTMVDENYTAPVADPATIYRNAEDEVSDSTFTKQIIASSDPDKHVKRIRLIQKLGATTIVLMNVSGNDPHAALRVYGESVLPQLRDT